MAKETPDPRDEKIETLLRAGGREVRDTFPIEAREQLLRNRREVLARFYGASKDRPMEERPVLPGLFPRFFGPQLGLVAAALVLLFLSRDVAPPDGTAPRLEAPIADSPLAAAESALDFEYEPLVLSYDVSLDDVGANGTGDDAQFAEDETVEGAAAAAVDAVVTELAAAVVEEQRELRSDRLVSPSEYLELLSFNDNDDGYYDEDEEYYDDYYYEEEAV